jgi:hypothetical protein
VPFAGDVSGFALSTFLDKTASRIASDRADIIGDDPEADSVEAKFSKGVRQDQTDRLAPQPDTKLRGIKQSDREASALIMFIEIIDPNFPQ